MIWPLLVIAWFTLSGAWLLYLEHKTKCEDESSLPDAPGDFTPEQVTLYFRMKAQYGAKLDDLPDMNSNERKLK